MHNYKKKSNTVDIVWQLAKPIAESLGLDIWDVRFLKEGSDWFLRIFIEKDDGVTIEDCEKLSRAIDQPLDELNPIDTPYCLEVCSPGLERELIRQEHFESFIGSSVIVKTIRPLENIGREFVGILEGFDNGLITIGSIDNHEHINVSKKDVVFVKLNDFND